MEIKAARKQGQAIDFALRLNPVTQEKLRELQRAITLPEALVALERANVFELAARDNWKANIAVGTVSSPAALLGFLKGASDTYCDGKPFEPAQVKRVAVSLHIRDNTSAPWEQYTANVVSLQIDATTHDGRKQTTYHGLKRDAFVVAIRMANPKFDAQAVYAGAIQLPLA